MDIFPGKNAKGEVNTRDVDGKALGLYKLSRVSGKYGYEVPDFFVVPADYTIHRDKIFRRTESLEGEGNFAVRSSYSQEDSAMNSFAGKFETLLDVSEWNLTDAIRKVRASLKSERAQKYAKERGIALDGRMAVIVQRMVNPEIGGVIYSTLPNYPVAASIEYCPGSGRGVVDGTAKIKIEDYDKQTLDLIFENENDIRSDEVKNIFKFGFPGDSKTAIRISQELEREFGYPLDMEFAWNCDGNRSKLYLLQARPITDIQPYTQINIPDVPEENVLLRANVVRGIGAYEGPAAIHTSRITQISMTNNALEQLGLLDRTIILKEQIRKSDSSFQDGYVLFVPDLFTSLDCDGLTPNKKAIVEFSQSRRCSHALTAAREKGILYMGKGTLGDAGESYKEDIVSKIKNGDIVKVVLNGREGIVYKVRDGHNPFPVDFF